MMLLAPLIMIRNDLTLIDGRKHTHPVADDVSGVKSQDLPSSKGNPASKGTASRFRRSGLKSRDGCSVCKIRRVKCDELKPECKRCTSTGRKCDGYAAAPTTTNGTPRATVRILPGCDVISNPAVEAQGTYAQRRSFHYFRARRMTDSPGNFEPTFWETLVLRYSQTFPTVKQSLVALSYMYEEYEECGSVLASCPFRFSPSAIFQYNRAVRELVDYIASKDHDSTVALVSCLIFIWIELIQGNLNTACRHLDGGIKILNDPAASQRLPPNSPWGPARRKGTINDVNEIQGSLSRSFARLRVQAVVCGYNSPTFVKFRDTGFHAFSSIPDSFANIFESRNHLDYEYNSIFDFFREIRDIDHRNDSDMRMLRDKKRVFLDRLAKWKIANSRMTTESVPTRGHPYSSSVLYLDLYYTGISVMLKTICAPSEMVFDEYLDDFDHIYSTSRSLIHNSTNGTPLLSLDMGIIIPLCMIICKCRFLPLRMKALKLLESAADHEGMLNKRALLIFCREKIKLEEQGRGTLLDTDPLPEAARMYKKRVVFENMGQEDEEVRRYFYFGKGPVEVDLFVKEELGKRVVNFKIVGDVMQAF